MAYTSGRAGPDNIFVKRWDRADEPVQLTYNDDATHLGVSSRDGRLLSFHKHTTGGSVHTVLSLDSEPGGGIAVASEVELPIPGGISAFSPDGDWIAYASEGNVHVTTTTGSGPRMPVSTDGGRFASWGESGEIFYRNGDQTIAVPVETRPELRRGDPVVLFEGAYATSPGSGNFEVSADGQTFVMVVQHGSAPELPTSGRLINIVLNWVTMLEQRVGN